MIVCPQCLKGYHPKVNFCPVCNLPLPKGDGGAATAAASATTQVAASAAETVAVVTSVEVTQSVLPQPFFAAMPREIPEPPPVRAPEPEPTFAAAAVETRSFVSAAVTAPGLAQTDTRAPEGSAMRAAQAELSVAMEEVKAVAGSTAIARSQGVELVANVNRILVEGTGVILTFRLSTATQEPLVDVQFQISSDKALVHPVEDRVSIIEHDDPAEMMLELELAPNCRGERMLNCLVTYTQLGRRKVMKGVLRARILKEPSGTNLSIDLSNIGNQVVTGESNAGLGAEHRSDLRISELVDLSKIKTLNDLLNTELPDNLVHIDLRQVSDEPTGARVIASPFLRRVEAGTVLTLESSEEGMLPLRLVARPQFVFGRQRDVCDVITWFLPRNPRNDEHTRSMSKVHVVASATSRGLFFRSRNETNGSSLSTPDGTIKVETTEPGTRFEDYARLVMSAGPGVNYVMDLNHQAAEGSMPPVADNGRLWPGPGVEAKAASGCVVMRPRRRDPVFRNCIWLFTEVAFGSDERLPIYIPDSDLASIQGRIHHYRGCFWVENSADGGIVQVDGHRLRPGELAPLCSGMKVKLGTMEVIARVEV